MLAEASIFAWEERKKSRTAGGALCKSRKTCVLECLVLFLRQPFDGAGGQVRTGAGKVRLVNLARQYFSPFLLASDFCHSKA